jgi:hypothetical protein
MILSPLIPPHLAAITAIPIEAEKLKGYSPEIRDNLRAI